MSNLALQRRIHVGCRDLGIDNETRRELQLMSTGKASMKDMTDADLKTVLKALENRGLKPFSKGASKRHPRAPRADLRLIHKLWTELGKAGHLKRPGRDGLNAFIRSRFEATWGSVPLDVDMLTEWRQIDDVILALKSWGERTDIEFDWEAHRR